MTIVYIYTLYVVVRDHEKWLRTPRGFMSVRGCIQSGYKVDHLGRVLEVRSPRVWIASFTQQCNPKDICEVALKLGWKGKTLDASSASRFLVAEAEHWGRVFRERSEAGSELCGLEDFVCVRGLGLSGFYLHCTADFEIVAALDETSCLMTVDAVLY